MKSQIEILEERIDDACASTPSGTRARMKALSKIKWRLESFEGLCGGLDDKFGVALVSPHNAQVFDGRDNEQMKKRYYEAALGVELAIVLLD
jgi:hypothetical protein